jgi:hypothetical protein
MIEIFVFSSRVNVSMVIIVNVMIFHAQEKMIWFVRVYKTKAFFKNFSSYKKYI